MCAEDEATAQVAWTNRVDSDGGVGGLFLAESTLAKVAKREDSFLLPMGPSQA